MALDFPASPALSDRWTAPTGVVYVWDGTKWATVPGGGGGGTPIAEPVGAGTWGRLESAAWQRSVATAGDTMTGNLTMDNATGIILNRVSGAAGQVQSHTSGVMRWVVNVATGDAESTGNAGSNFAISRFDDAGAYINDAIKISRASGVVDFLVPPTVGGVAAPYVLKTGDVMTGELTVAAGGITYSGRPNAHTHSFDWTGTALNAYVDGNNVGQLAIAGGYVLKTGDVMTGALRAPDINAFSATNVWGAGGNLRFGAWDQYTYLLNTDVSGIGYLGRLDAGVWAGVMNFVPGATTVYGTLRTTGRIYAGNASGVAMDQSDEAVHYRDGSGNVVMQYNSGGWYDHWAAATGTRAWNGAGVGQMSLDGGGNLWIGGSHTVSWNLSVAQAGTFGGGLTAPSASISGQVTAGRVAVGPSYWDTNGIALANNFAVSGSAAAYGGIIFYDSSYFVTQDSATRYIFMANPYGWGYVRATGDALYNSAAGAHLYIDQANGARIYNSRGPMCGMGAYQDWSDRRMKENIAPATEGLAEILQLVPMKFNRITAPSPERDPSWPEDTPIPAPIVYPVEIGFVAQDVAPIIPEAVAVAGVALADGSGTFEDANPTLAITSATIVAVLVNAVKEISARLTTAGI